MLKKELTKKKSFASAEYGQMLVKSKEILLSDTIKELGATVDIWDPRKNSELYFLHFHDLKITPDLLGKFEDTEYYLVNISEVQHIIAISTDKVDKVSLEQLPPFIKRNMLLMAFDEIVFAAMDIQKAERKKKK